ncbi:MAG: DUF1847 domain-containing protein [Candidatus Bathyarchaeota archaeon]|nr:MAG: DUF1847 domain-containing protein [Candidatus Bathyarchaeota archaeon]
MRDQMSLKPQCALCSVMKKVCMAENGVGPVFCPTLNCKESIALAIKEYESSEIREFARMASVQEAECYANRHIKPYVSHPVKPRVQEIVEFARKMSYTKLGVAFCAGLQAEAQALTEILNAQGFDVVSVNCKVGGTPKEVIGIIEDEKIRIGEFESMCSPIVQANLLNRENSDFNILVGLCVGHDSLFFKYSKAFTTVLISKDRVLAHNPAGALYTTGNYYARLLKPGIDPPAEIL